jgi:hypothetical protein
MDEVSTLTALLDFGGQIALIAILLWLLFDERRQRLVEREQCRNDMARLNNDMLSLLRDLVGLRVHAVGEGSGAVMKAEHAAPH